MSDESGASADSAVRPIPEVRAAAGDPSGTEPEDDDFHATNRDTAATNRDQLAQRRDEVSDRRDEVSDRRDLAADLRDDSSRDRDDTAGRRDNVARDRDRGAHHRDQDAELRDRQAELRDHQQSSRIEPEQATDDPATGRWLDRGFLAARNASASDRRHAAQDRAAANSERSSAILDRDTAAIDRASGAVERTLAANDRRSALVDRESGAAGRGRAESDRDDASSDRGSAAEQRRGASLDELTGAYGRGPGFLQLTREIARSRRLKQSLVVVFVDVDHLKQTNDAYGHAAGDEVLTRVATMLQASLRPYDLVVRYGGDEFFVVIAGVDLPIAEHRFQQLIRSLSEASTPISVSVGMAELQPTDTAPEIVARADSAMYASRSDRRAP